MGAGHERFLNSGKIKVNIQPFLQQEHLMGQITQPFFYFIFLGWVSNP
jgi:hypothetical protein